ncbi:hypothetical protein YSY43_31330 [Paenibacillus sp. YSY-4.3]
MVFRISTTWIISCVVVAVAYPEKFFFLLYGLVFGIMLLIFTLFLAIGDYLLNKVNLKKKYLHLILNLLISLIIALLLGGTQGLVIGGIVGLTYILVDKYKLFFKK